MKMWKYLILLAGICGVAGFFLPFIRVTEKPHDVHAEVSALQLVRGASTYVELAEHKAGPLKSHATERLLQHIDDKVDAFRGFIIGLYAPAALLALLGAAGVVRNRLGRLGGLLSLVLGIATTGIWLAFMFVSRQDRDPSFDVVMGDGLHLLLVAGSGGILAGLGALMSPDR
jgi:hypothetical protein